MVSANLRTGWFQKKLQFIAHKSQNWPKKLENQLQNVEFFKGKNFRTITGKHNKMQNLPKSKLNNCKKSKTWRSANDFGVSKNTPLFQSGQPCFRVCKHFSASHWVQMFTPKRGTHWLQTCWMVNKIEWFTHIIIIRMTIFLPVLLHFSDKVTFFIPKGLGVVVVQEPIMNNLRWHIRWQLAMRSMTGRHVILECGGSVNAGA